MKKKIIISLFLSIILTGCVEVLDVVRTVSSSIPLSEQEVTSGLKEALITGAINTASRLSAQNGYFGDNLIKILLPEEANIIINNLSKMPGGKKLVNDAVLSINRAAEDAASEAGPIFADSIRQMSITDAFSILRGADNAAAVYLKNTTFSKLHNLYKPRIQNSIEKDIIGGVSTKESWDALTGKWNIFANSLAGRIAGLDPVNTDLGEYLTKKALDGIFLKVEKEEAKIRNQASARITPLLKRVFGSIDGNLSVQ